MSIDYQGQLNFVRHTFHQSYLFLIPWGTYFVLDLLLSAIEYVSPTMYSGGILYRYFLTFSVVETILLMSVASYTLIKLLFVSKRTISYVWQRFTPTFETQISLYDPVQLDEDEMKKSIHVTKYGIMLGLIFALLAPTIGVFPLRYGSVLYTQLPDIPYSPALNELLSGFPIVGELFVLDLISQSSPTTVYVPIAISVFLFILGLWNFAHLFINRTAVCELSNSRTVIFILKVGPYLTPILALMSHLSR